MKMPLLINEIEIHQIICHFHCLTACFRLFKSLRNADTLQNDLNVLCPMLKNKE
jgi:hypothetical protein